MVTQYKGWVPNVTCRLSFSHIGNTTNPTPCISANIADRETRYVVCYQARETLDYLIPFKHQAAGILGLEGKMWCVCTGQTAEHDGHKLEKLYGRLYLFHDKSHWRGKPQTIVARAQDELRNLDSDDRRSPLADSFDAKFSRLEDDLMGLSSFHVGFQLVRCGEVEVMLDENLPISPNAPNFPDAHRKATFNHLISSQLFFFLRDICHEHQHHDPRTDTIVDLHEANDDYDWRVQTLYALYRKIIQYKRTRTPGMVVDSLGTLAYTQAFKRLCDRAVKGTSKQLPDYSDSSLRESLNVAHIGLAAKAEFSRHRQDTTRNLLIGTLGTAFAFASLHALTKQDIPGESSEFLRFGAMLLVNQTEYILVSILSVVLLITYPPTQWQFSRNLVRAFQPLKKKVQIGLFYLLFFIVALLTSALLSL